MPHTAIAAGVAAGLVGVAALAFAYLIVREMNEAVHGLALALTDDAHLDVYGTDDDEGPMVYDERWDVEGGEL